MSHTDIPFLKEDHSEYWKFKVFTPDTKLGNKCKSIVLEPQQIELLRMGFSLVVTSHSNKDHSFLGDEILLAGISLRWSNSEASRRLKDVRKIAEIGVSYGNNAWRLCATLKPEEIHLIDPYLDVPENVIGDSTPPQPEAPFQFAQLILSNVPCFKYFHKQKSHEAYAKFPDGFFDFVYIDGDHSYEAVKQDIADWFPKVRKGGIIAGDDLHKDGVRPAVTEFFRTFEESQNGYEWLVMK